MTSTQSHHPLFPTSSHLLDTSRPEASTSRLAPNLQKTTTVTKSTSTTPMTTPPRSCRRPSPLRNNSFCSDDLEREQHPAGRREEREGDADGDDEDEGMTSSFCESVDERQELGFNLAEKEPAKLAPLTKPFSLRAREVSKPKRRDSGSEVEDALGGGGLDFSSPFMQAQNAVETGDVVMKEPVSKITLSEKPRSKVNAPVSRATYPSPASIGNQRTINYNPGPMTNSKSTSFIRPKPSFPRSAPLRPLTLTLSSSNASSGPNAVVGTGGRYSTPHAGMVGAGAAGKSASQQGRQKVIVPTKGWKMSFDLGLTQSELAREA